MARRDHDEDAAIEARATVERAERQAQRNGQVLTERDCARLADSTYRALTGDRS